MPIPSRIFSSHEVAHTVGTQSPKKVFLDANINAAVFYDSNFWSMFLPVRKNLLIGMGLINSATQQELKAILTHEFGHFSQRSMKIGSYVYNVNRIIYNAVYNNNFVHTMYERSANIGMYSRLFITIAMIIIKRTQEILEKRYTYVNRNYLALSWEMEFHADEIAANLAGTKALSDLLLRIPVASQALETVFTFYQRNISQNICSANIYPEQRFVLDKLAQKYDFQLQNGFPNIEPNQLSRVYGSQLALDNQWASHPSQEDRVKALLKLNIEVEESMNLPAMDLLVDATAIGRRFTHQLFNVQMYNDMPTIYSFDEFQEHFSELIAMEHFDERFRGYYENNDLVVPTASWEPSIDPQDRFEDLYSDLHVEKINELGVLRNERSQLQAIKNGEIIVRTFDYCGHKHSSDQIDTVLGQVDAALALLENETALHELRIHSHFRRLATAQDKQHELSERQEKYQTIKAHAEQSIQLFNDLSSNGMFVFTTTTYDDPEAQISDFSRKETALKKALQALLANAEIVEKLDGKIKQDLETYIVTELTDVQDYRFQNENIKLRWDAISQLGELSYRYHYNGKKNLLDFYLFLEESSPKEDRKTTPSAAAS